MMGGRYHGSPHRASGPNRSPPRWRGGEGGMAYAYDEDEEDEDEYGFDEEDLDDYSSDEW